MKLAKPVRNQVNRPDRKNVLLIGVEQTALLTGAVDEFDQYQPSPFRRR